MPPDSNLSRGTRTLSEAWKTVLFLSVCGLALTAGECTTINPQTFLDGAHDLADRTSPLVDIDHLDAPGVVLVGDAGDSFMIEVRAEDAGGAPVPDTEARVNAEFDPAVLELLHACGGNDTDPRRPACDGLVPAYHLFDNDGVMWFFFRALQVGETDIRFVYPGALEILCESCPSTSNPFKQPPGPAEGGYTDEVVTHVVIGGAPADEDGDGVPDFRDDCPGTPHARGVDENGCALPDTDGDGALDSVDNCPAAWNPDQADADKDGTGDVCDPVNDLDTDGDGVPNGTDNCPGEDNPDQADADLDGTGDTCDTWPTISWTNNNAYGFRGQNGKRESYTCPSESDPDWGGGSTNLNDLPVYGTDIYTDDSYICYAAVHAGVITLAGGRITIEIRPGQMSYPGSTRNGVTTRTWGEYWGSFVFVE